MHSASYEFLMKPKESARCHQTLSSQVGSEDETNLCLVICLRWWRKLHKVYIAWLHSETCPLKRSHCICVLFIGALLSKQILGGIITCGKLTRKDELLSGTHPLFSRKTKIACASIIWYGYLVYTNHGKQRLGFHCIVIGALLSKQTLLGIWEVLIWTMDY